MFSMGMNEGFGENYPTPIAPNGEFFRDIWSILYVSVEVSPDFHSPMKTFENIPAYESRLLPKTGAFSR